MRSISNGSVIKVFTLLYDQIKKIPLSMNGDLLSVLKVIINLSYKINRDAVSTALP